MQSETQFCRSLIKGKIAEIIFELMFQHTDRYKLVHFGYEFTAPELMDKDLKTAENRRTLESIQHAPDFVEIDDKHRATLVEVKYRSKLDGRYTLKIAQKLAEKWPETWLFLATPTGFLFDPVKKIIEGNGYITPLSHENSQNHSQSLSGDPSLGSPANLQLP